MPHFLGAVLALVKTLALGVRAHLLDVAASEAERVLIAAVVGALEQLMVELDKAIEELTRPHEPSP